MGCKCQHEDGPAEPAEPRPARTQHEVHSNGRVILKTSDEDMANECLGNTRKWNPDATVETVPVP